MECTQVLTNFPPNLRARPLFWTLDAYDVLAFESDVLAFDDDYSGAPAMLLFVFSLFCVRNAGAGVCGSSHVNLTHSLPVSGGFNIFVRTFGCASGAPILFLHGGWGPLPGEDSSTAAGLVDTERNLVVYFHQRGWGSSSPVGSLVHNTVADSIADCEVVRKHAEVVQWAAVYGGSNGAMLGLAYAASHPGAVGSIVLRGLWLIRTQDVEYDYVDTAAGKAAHYPQEWDRFAAAVGCSRESSGSGAHAFAGGTESLLEPQCRGLTLLERYRTALAGDAPAPLPSAARAAEEWLRYDALGASVRVGGATRLEEWLPTPPLAAARLGVHLYLGHSADVESEVGAGRLLATAQARLASVSMPVRLITGEYDMLCPPAMAYEVAAALGGHSAGRGSLQVVRGAAHSAGDANMTAVIRAAIDELAQAAVATAAASRSGSGEL